MPEGAVMGIDLSSGQRSNQPSERPRILVVEESRMVRAMLGKTLREHFDVREEADGESAWQVLVLDHSIRLVICALALPVLDGDGLLQRLRGSRLQRLARMPMLMVTGDDDAAIERARNHGASDFISRGAGTAELLTRVSTLLTLGRTQQDLQENLEQHVQNPQTGLFTRKYIELQAAQALSHALRHGSEVSAVVLSFDNVGALRETYGGEVIDELQKRFISMLGGKIRREDSLGHYAGSQLVVVSPGTSYSACAAFGVRLRDAISAASISVHGRRLNLSVSVGVSNSPTDIVTSAGALIELAAKRLGEAQRAGGNRIVTCQEVYAPEAVPEQALPLLAEGQKMSLELALEWLSAGQEAQLRPYMPTLLADVMPLLCLLEREYGMGLPLADLERRCADLAQGKEDAGQK